MINGQIEFYDEESEWGLIRGDDNHLYELRSAQLPAPRVGDKVLFEPQTTSGGPRAVAVRRPQLTAARCASSSSPTTFRASRVTPPGHSSRGSPRESPREGMSCR